jgi:peptide/nickel transport system permease protein
MSTDMTEVSSKSKTEKKRHSLIVDLLIRMIKEKRMGTVGGVITLLLLLTAIFANFLAPYGPNVVNPDINLLPPSAHFLLGTDNLGRDMLSRIIYGARVSVTVGLAASLMCTLVETILGLLCGYIGGTFDLIVQRIVDAVMCFPGLILMMVLISIIGPGLWTIILVLGITWGIAGSRLIRSATIAIKENTYVQAARATGCSTGTILFRHLMPNIMSTMIISFTMRVPGVILTEASLSFLGYGIPPPAPSWGAMLSGMGRTYMFLAPWIVIWPGLALTITVFGVNMFGDALRDLLDPRMRGGIGRYGLKAKGKTSVKSESSVSPSD